jgi:predicted Zn finger-like uncharacterized protein
MAIRFACPTCRTRLSVPDDAAGGSVRCPECRALDRIPAESDTAVQTAEDTAEQPVPLFPSVAGEVVALPPPGRVMEARPIRALTGPRSPFRAGLGWGLGFWLAGLVALAAGALVRTAFAWVTG